MAVTALATAVVSTVAASTAMSGWQATHQPDIPEVKAPQVNPDVADVANENEAQKAAESRRRMYQGMGRSSTILTDPNRLGDIGKSTDTPKRLLGL